MSSNNTPNVFQYTGSETVPAKYVRVVHFDCSVVGVEARTFRECTKLKEVVLNEGLQTIGAGAFSRCQSLQSFALPSTVIDIGWEAFYNCSNLREVVLNKGLEKIGKGAFCRCSSLESITIPSSVIDIGHHAFWFCSSLREVVLNEGTVTHYPQLSLRSVLLHFLCVVI